jgi:hypothetical protein
MLLQFILAAGSDVLGGFIYPVSASSEGLTLPGKKEPYCGRCAG